MHFQCTQQFNLFKVLRFAGLSSPGGGLLSKKLNALTNLSSMDDRYVVWQAGRPVGRSAAGHRSQSRLVFRTIRRTLPHVNPSPTWCFIRIGCRSPTPKARWPSPCPRDVHWCYCTVEIQAAVTRWTNVYRTNRWFWSSAMQARCVVDPVLVWGAGYDFSSTSSARTLRLCSITSETWNDDRVTSIVHEFWPNIFICNGCCC